LDEEKSKHARLAQQNGFGPEFLHSFLRLVKGTAKPKDWLDSLIGPGGLLLVVSHLFAVPVLVLWLGLEKSKLLNLDVRNIFAGSHTEHHWRCSKPQFLSPV
jgi:hypothetical protein